MVTTMSHRYYGQKPDMDQYEFRRISEIPREEFVSDRWGDRIILWVCAGLLLGTLLSAAWPLF